VKTPEEWGYGVAGAFAACVCLYFFLFGLDVLGTGAKVMSGCSAGELFGDDTNPVAGLMIGILCTVLLQSSSTTTSIIVSLVGSAITVRNGIYMIMGANIGTSVTNTIVAMGQLGDGDQLERAFAGATVHDMFNFMSVAILLPVEAATGYLDELTGAITKNAEVEDGEKWEGPIKKIVEPLGALIIKENKDVTKAIAKGEGSCDEGGGYYPIICLEDEPEWDCTRYGLIKCDDDTEKCPVFFSKDASAQDDKVSGGVCFFLGIVILFICMFGLVTVLQKMLAGVSTRIIYKATDVNGYFSMIIGIGITIVVQSSSITTSVLTPLVGVGALRLEQMLPLTLGANIGTTLTAIMSAMVSDNVDSLQVALAHLFFNITGILIWYPIPVMRNIPLYAARQLGKCTRVWRGFPILYIAVMFFLVPMIFLGISYFFEQDSTGFNVLGSFIVVIVACSIAKFVYYWNFENGREICFLKFTKYEHRRATMATLPDDMSSLKAEIAALKEHTGYTEPEKEEDPDEEAGEIQA